jgi:hypothetical protein
MRDRIHEEDKLDEALEETFPRAIRWASAGSRPIPTKRKKRKPRCSIPSSPTERPG